MIPQPCHYCNMFVSRDREGRAVATNPAVAEPWTCPAAPSGHLIAATAAMPDDDADSVVALRRIADEDIGGNCPWLADELKELARALELEQSGPATAPPRRWSFTRDELAGVISHLEARIPASGPMAGKIDAGSMADAIAEGLEQRRAAIESCHFWDIRARECRYETLFLGCEPCAACPG